MNDTQRITIRVDDKTNVSGLWLTSPRARAAYVFGHGAGVGMEHPSMAAVATELADLGIATLRYQFPYMERGSKRPDAPQLCHATVRAAVAEATLLARGLPLFAGGRSFGGRMTSQAQAAAALPGVRGLAFLAFPLHPAGRPDTTRAHHLSGVNVPMLFLQGTRDELAKLELLQPVTAGLGQLARLHLLPDADHSFHVPARTGKKDSHVRSEALQALGKWVDEVVGG